MPLGITGGMDDGTPALLQEYVTGARELEVRFTDRGRTLLRGAIAVERMTGKETPLPPLSEQWPAKDRTKTPLVSPPADGR